MTENGENTTPESQPENPPAEEIAADSGMISLEDIDRFLEEDDPEFAMSLSEIVPEELGEDVEIDSVDLDEKSLAEEEEEKEKKPSLLERYPKVQEKIEKITTPLKALPDRAASQWVRTKNTSFDIIRAAWRFLKTDLPDRIKYTIGQIKAFHAWVKSRIQYFWAKPWLERSLYLGATLFILGFTTLIVLNLGGRWLPGLFDDYTRGFDMVADRVEEFDQKEWQKLDSAFPQPIFTVLLEKIVVNLSRSPGHRNPMGAFKFYVSVDSQETAVEVKDRETEILDYVQRAIEELSYEEVNGYGGRTQIKSLVRAEINRVLNQGRVQDVFIEIMITKP